MSSVVHHLFHVPAFSLIQGGLVKKILETKKDYESSSSALKSKDQVDHLLILTPLSPLEGSVVSDSQYSTASFFYNGIPQMWVSLFQNACTL